MESGAMAVVRVEGVMQGQNISCFSKKLMV